jgi:hypothetical protein
LDISNHPRGDQGKGEEIMEILDVLVTKEVLIIAAGIIAVLTAVQKAVPELRKAHWWRRLLPFVPLILGVGASFIPGISAEELGPRELVLMGLWAGFLSSHCRKIFKQAVLGRIKEDAS